MKDVLKYLTKDEKVYLSLLNLYESMGFDKFKLHKFEDYSLYLKNKSFLTGEYVLTFTDNNGKLLALKPDITLSIVKNTKATACQSEKVYYHENVYRFDKHSHEYKEISQIGLEVLGNIDEAVEFETVVMALKSLEAIDEDFVLDVSHTAFFEDVLLALPDGEKFKSQIAECIRAKNPHDFLRTLEEAGASNKFAADAAEILSFGGDFVKTLSAAAKLDRMPNFSKAAEGLQKLYLRLCECGFSDKLRLDFSLLNDTDYYNGIIFQGYVKKVPHSVLSGGRYDRLVKKLGKNGVGGMGFAIYLSDMSAFYSDEKAAKKQRVIIYGEGDDINAVENAADELRQKGFRVRVEKNPPSGFKQNEIIFFGGELC